MIRNLQSTRLHTRIDLSTVAHNKPPWRFNAHVLWLLMEIYTPDSVILFKREQTGWRISAAKTLWMCPRTVRMKIGTSREKGESVIAGERFWCVFQSACFRASKDPFALFFRKQNELVQINFLVARWNICARGNSCFPRSVLGESDERRSLFYCVVCCCRSPLSGFHFHCVLASNGVFRICRVSLQLIHFH